MRSFISIEEINNKIIIFFYNSLVPFFSLVGVIYMVNNIIINKKFIEFKYNTCKIDKYPQFLSVSANKFIKSIDYAEYFYDNYINDICKLINIDVPNKTDYLKTVYNNDYNKLELFIELKEKEHLIMKEKK